MSRWAKALRRSLKDDEKGRMWTVLGAVGAGLAFARWAVARRGALDLHGKTVVVTGASRGLGLEIAREFARRGANLVLVARNEVALESARAELAREGHPTHTIHCDVRDPESVERMVALAHARFGHIDVLVNDAGTIEVGPLETMTREDFARSIDTHFWGPLSTSMAVLPEMRARKSGRIVNVASIGGLIPVPHLAPYSASKAALVGLSGAMGAELARDGVYVTTVCPGLMITGSPRNAHFKGQHRKEYAWFSIGDALPFTAMSSTRAARRIVNATVRGEPMVVFGAEARLASLANALFPNLFARTLSLVNRLLPAPGGIGQEMALGSESFSPASPSLLTALDERAARKNNEI